MFQSVHTAAMNRLGMRLSLRNSCCPTSLYLNKRAVSFQVAGQMQLCCPMGIQAHDINVPWNGNHVQNDEFMEECIIFGCVSRANTECQFMGLSCSMTEALKEYCQEERFNVPVYSRTWWSCEGQFGWMRQWEGMKTELDLEYWMPMQIPATPSPHLRLLEAQNDYIKEDENKRNIICIVRHNGTMKPTGKDGDPSPHQCCLKKP